MRDFILKKYAQLLEALQDWGFFFVPFKEFLEKPKENVIILRHDVDRLPENSLKTAIIEHELGITGTYYFRISSESYDEEIIKR